MAEAINDESINQSIIIFNLTPIELSYAEILLFTDKRAAPALRAGSISLV